VVVVYPTVVVVNSAK